MSDLQLRALLADEVRQQAAEGRARRAWLDGRDVPQIEPAPAAALPPALADRAPEPRKPGLLKTIALGAAVIGGTAGVGAGGAYLHHLLSRTGPPQPAAQPAADVVQWLGEHGYDRPPK